ncbi:MAG: PKD domain-containing protein, partial [Flavobacteriales bacterium]
TVIEPPKLTLDSLVTTDSRCLDSTGTATAYLSGGVGGYSYDWSNDDSSMTADTLSYGRYNVEMTDSNGCSLTKVFNISDSLTPAVNASAQDETCDGACDGKLFASASGGTKPYTYSWNDGSYTGDTLENMCQGSYTLIVKDKNGCKSDDTSLFINSGSPKPYIQNISVPSSATIGETVSFSSSSISATSFRWDFGDGEDTTGQNTQYAYDTLGTFTVVFTASNSSCSVTESATITVDCGSGDTLIQSINVPDSVDMGDTAMFSANTSLVDSFLWEFGDGVDSAEENSEHVYDTSGTFVVTLNASNNFCSDSKSETIEVLDPNSIVEDQKGLKDAINIYPNPTKGKVNIEIEKSELSLEKINVINALGEKVKTLQFNGEKDIYKFDLKEQAEGLYLMILYNKNGQSITKKVSIFKD